MPRASSAELLVLLGLRLTSLAEAVDLSRRWALRPVVVEELLTGADARGLVRYRRGQLHGWALTRAGRHEVERLLEAELVASGEAPALEADYAAFRARNEELLEVCTAWQLRPVAGEHLVNEHDDRVYDQGCLARLEALHDQATPTVRDLAERFERFGSYLERLEEALARLRAGKLEWFTSPGVDSYHTVWFELHEHLLVSLGLDRACEAAPGAPV